MSTITGYKAQYRKKAAAGEDAVAWTAYSGTLGATATTFNLAGVEAGATYEAQVRDRHQRGEATARGRPPGRAGPTGRPPPPARAFNGGTFPVGTIADYKETGQGAVGVLFSDADSDALTYSAAAQHPALLGGEPDRRRRRGPVAGDSPQPGGRVQGDLHGQRRPTVDRSPARRPSASARRRAGALPRTPPPARRWARSGDRDAVQQRCPDLLSDGQCGGLGTVRHRLVHGADQRQAGRDAGL